MKKSFLQTIAIVMAIVTMLSTALSLSAGAATTKFLDTDNKYVYITNFSDQDKRLIEKKTAKDYTNSRFASDNSIAVVDFLELRENDSILAVANELVDNGKYLYVRASGHLANQTLLNEMFDSKDTGNVMYDEASLLNRDSTTGFLVYKDSLGDLQTPRFYSIIAQSEHEETIGELKQSKVIDNKETIRPEETFEDELSTLEHAFTHYTQDVAKSFQQDVPEVKTQTFEGGKNHYQKVVDTVSLKDAAGVTLGTETRRLYAYRLHPKATNSTGKPTPASPASPNETRWAWKAVSTVSPKWNEQKTFILNSNLWLRTFPTGSGNATYKQIITDYAPTVALSGKSSATLDLSTGGASIKFTANFNHVNIEVLDYAAGLKTTYNLARIRYTVPCTLYPALWSEAKNTLDFPMGVATSNTGNKNACIQLDSQIKLGKYKNLTNYTWYEWPVKYFAWAVPVR